MTDVTDGRRAANPWLLLAAVCLLAVAVLDVSSQRTGFARGVETDFVAGFVLEAQRALAGEPLQVRYHPPGYAFAAAAAYQLTGDWLAAGLWISALAALAAALASAFIAQRLLGPPAALGAFAAVLCSSPFLSYASQATSDMYFSGLLASCLAVAIAGMDRPTAGRWFVAGVLAGLTVLARTNGVALACLVAAPLLVPVSWDRRAKLALIVLAGMLLPIGAWWGYATQTGSPVWPTHNHVNLAIAAYSGGPGGNAEEIVAAERQFRSTLEVVAYDPAAMAERFARRLAQLPVRLLMKMTWLPIGLLAVFGFAAGFRRLTTREFVIYATPIVMVTALSGINAFWPRSHLHLVPMAGGFAALACATALRRLPVGRSGLAAAWMVVCLALVPVAWRVHAGIVPQLENEFQDEIREATLVVQAAVEPGALLYLRKPHLAFYTKIEMRMVPEALSIDALFDEFCADGTADRPAYLYVGSIERKYRPELTAAMAASPTPAWLRPVARGKVNDWQLYKIVLGDHATAPGDAACSPAVAPY